MAFDVGDRVVYPHHGAAVIVRKETRDFNGEDTEYLVLEVKREETRVTISVPSEKVDDVGMRPPISRDEVEDLFDLLAKKDIREPANWSRRFKNHQEKLKSGDVYQVAEVVRNLSLRDQAKGLSAGEKSMFLKARSVLVSELSFALDLTEEDALDKVIDTLTKEPPESE
ncbi:MAG: CarD family transcriptional regulator [Microthrixaceae bacterium]